MEGPNLHVLCCLNSSVIKEEGFVILALKSYNILFGEEKDVHSTMNKQTVALQQCCEFAGNK